MQKLLVVLGPTATGKTDLAFKLAKIFDGELIACDSRQVYRGLDIGTGKMPGYGSRVRKSRGFWEINGIKIWMYDVVSPSTQYTVADYVKDTTKVIFNILKRGKLPMIVGGTGFYLKALLEGLPNLAIPIDPALRRGLEKLSLEKLQNKLQTLSPSKWEKLNNSDRNNKRRLMRSIELIYMYPYIKTNQISNIKNQKYDVLKIGLIAPRPMLYQKINSRVLLRVDQGMVEEAKRLHKSGLSYQRMKELGLEYGIMAQYLEGKCDINQLIEKLKIKIHQYAKRQLTWFKREKNIEWFDVSKRNWSDDVENQVSAWYNA